MTMRCTSVFAIVVLLIALFDTSQQTAAQAKPESRGEFARLAVESTTSDEIGAVEILHGMLQLLPERFGAEEGTTNLNVSYANIALQLETLGLSSLDGSDLSFATARQLDLSRIWYAAEYVSIEKSRQSFEQVLGFELAEIDQVIGGDSPAGRIAILKGRFDLEAVRVALTSSGYLWSNESGLEVARFGDDGVADFSSTTSTVVFDLSAYNVAILPDRTIAVAGTIEAMRSVIAVVLSGSPSLAEMDGVQMLLRGLPADLVAASFFDGSEFDISCDGCTITDMFGTSTQSEEMKTLVCGRSRETTPMPPAKLVAVGITAGGPGGILDESSGTTTADVPQSKTVISVLFESEADAAIAGNLLPGRLNSGISFSLRKSWRETFVEHSIAQLGTVPVIQILLTPAPGHPPVWHELLNLPDFPFLSYWTTSGLRD